MLVVFNMVFALEKRVNWRLPKSCKNTFPSWYKLAFNRNLVFPNLPILPDSRVWRSFFVVWKWYCLSTTLFRTWWSRWLKDGWLRSWCPKVSPYVFRCPTIQTFPMTTEEEDPNETSPSHSFVFFTSSTHTNVRSPSNNACERSSVGFWKN